MVSFACLVAVLVPLVAHHHHLHLVLQEHLQEELDPVWLWREGEEAEEQKSQEQEVQMALLPPRAVPDPFCSSQKQT